MADSMCGPSNPAKGLTQHLDQDRSRQQDRFTQGPAHGASFRSATGAAQTREDADFALFKNFEGSDLHLKYRPGPRLTRDDQDFDKFVMMNGAKAFTGQPDLSLAMPMHTWPEQTQTHPSHGVRQQDIAAGWVSSFAELNLNDPVKVGSAMAQMSPAQLHRFHEDLHTVNARANEPYLWHNNATDIERMTVGTYIRRRPGDWYRFVESGTPSQALSTAFTQPTDETMDDGARRGLYSAVDEELRRLNGPRYTGDGPGLLNMRLDTDPLLPGEAITGDLDGRHDEAAFQEAMKEWMEGNGPATVTYDGARDVSGSDGVQATTDSIDLKGKGRAVPDADITYPLPASTNLDGLQTTLQSGPIKLTPQSSSGNAENTQEDATTKQDDTDLSRVAQQVVDSVKDVKNDKFQKSSFFSLMRELAEKRVILGDNDLVEAQDVAGPSSAPSAPGFGSHATGSRMASPETLG